MAEEKGNNDNLFDLFVSDIDGYIKKTGAPKKVLNVTVSMPIVISVQEEPTVAVVWWSPLMSNKIAKVPITEISADVQDRQSFLDEVMEIILNKLENMIVRMGSFEVFKSELQKYGFKMSGDDPISFDYTINVGELHTIFKEENPDYIETKTIIPDVAMA